MATLEVTTDVNSKYSRKQLAIINAAIPVFNARGLKGTTFADIAASIGMATTSITYYFKKKEDLAAACYLQAIDEFIRLIEAALSASTPAERVRKFLHGYMELRCAIGREDKPPLMLFHEILALTASPQENVFSAYTQMFQYLRTIFKPARADSPPVPSLNSAAFSLLFQVLWAPTWLGRYKPEDSDRVAEHIFDIFVYGIAMDGRAGTESSADVYLHPQDPKNKYLVAATELINDFGYHGASVDKIAAKLEMTKGSFYHYFGTKDELVEACFERTFDIFSRTFSAASAAENCSERIFQFSSSLIRQQAAGTAPLLSARALTTLPPKTREDILQTYGGLSDGLADLVIDGIIDGSLRPVDPFIASQMLACTIGAAADITRWVPGIRDDNAVGLYLQPLMSGWFRSGVGGGGTGGVS